MDELLSTQCCPMDTYDTDSAGDLRPVCTCGEGCQCLCTGCSCGNWGEEYDDKPPRASPFELWKQAGEDAVEYRRLMLEHGHLLRPGDPGYEDAPRSLPCGWPGPRAGGVSGG